MEFPGNETTFMALPYPLPDEAQQELKTLADDIAIARGRLSKVSATNDNEMIRMARMALGRLTTALDMVVVAMRDQIGVQVTRPTLGRFAKTGPEA